MGEFHMLLQGLQAFPQLRDKNSVALPIFIGRSGISYDLLRVV